MPRKYAELMSAHLCANSILEFSEKRGREHMREHYIGYEDKKTAQGHLDEIGYKEDAAKKAYKRAAKFEGEARSRRGY